MPKGLGLSQGLTGQFSSALFGKQQSGAGALDRTSNFQTVTPGFNLLQRTVGPPGSTTRLTELTPRDTDARLALNRRFPEFLRDVQGLREDVRPNFSAFRTAGLGQLANERDRTIGNLRESLARRGVLGSSFAADSLSRSGAEFGQRRAEFEAQVGLQEASATQALIGFENSLIMQQIAREFQEFSLAAGLEQNFSALMAQQAGLFAQLTQQDELIEVQRGEQARKIFETVSSSVAGGFGGGSIGGAAGG